MINRILDDREQRLLADEREWLGRLQRTLARLDASPADQAALERSILQLDQLFLLVVIGEFNAGKSAFINALLGDRVLDEGVTPTTTRIQMLVHGPSVTRSVVQPSTDTVTAPLDLLRELTIVDTPGTNAIHREHEAITGEFVPRSDLVLFVTSADRPFTESERAFLTMIRDWGKKILIVINKVDILESARDVWRVQQFVSENARMLLGVTPEIFPISARRALRAKQGDAEATAGPRDRFADLEHYIASTLDERERLRLKLLNPLGVGARLASDYGTAMRERLALLRDDVQTIRDIETQLAVYRDDLTREFTYRRSQIENVLHQFENRGIEFFDETVRLGRMPDLLNKARIKAEFERNVVADVPRRIEQQVSDVIDWLVASELRQWQAVMEHVNRRRSAHAGRIVGDAKDSFHYDRAQLLESVGRAAQRAVESYDREKEAAAIARSVQMAVAGTALAEVGAVGLGTLVALVASTTAADVTGIIAAGTLAVVGLFVIPSKRHQAKKELRARVAALREQLTTALSGQFQREVERSLGRINEAVAPYTRFVRAEREHLTRIGDELRDIHETLTRLKVDVGRIA